MIHIEENVNLKSFNTFGIDVSTRYFCRIHHEREIQELIRSKKFQSHRRLILGGGSNVLFLKDFDGLIIKTELKGIQTVREDEDTITLNVKSGEVWHHLVLHCVNQEWGGIENLSLIPGTVGAAPIQNIGAYGVELREVLDEVHGIDLSTGEAHTYPNPECLFGYRDSIFKHALKEKFFISSVTLTLTKKNHRFNTTYGALRDTLQAMNTNANMLQTISDAVIYIRQSKLPDPSQIGNAGSFFKNPVISLPHYHLLKKSFPGLPSYPTENQFVKVPAGWLIEQCGWKGKRINDIGIHTHQALVIINYGNGSGQEIFDLASKIISSVKEKFNITLTPEVNIIT
jgi:UDP-N-acetylmuramate dehydrogenase